MCGTVIGGWQMARAAIVAHKKLAEGAPDAAFYKAKLTTAQFYMQHIMPRAGAHSQAATAGSESIMAMVEDSF